MPPPSPSTLLNTISLTSSEDDAKVILLNTQHGEIDKELAAATAGLVATNLEKSSFGDRLQVKTQAAARSSDQATRDLSSFQSFTKTTRDSVVSALAESAFTKSELDVCTGALVIDARASFDQLAGLADTRTAIMAAIAELPRQKVSLRETMEKEGLAAKAEEHIRIAHQALISKEKFQRELKKQQELTQDRRSRKTQHQNALNESIKGMASLHEVRSRNEDVFAAEKKDYESKLSALKQEVTDLATASEAVQAKNAEWGTTILAQSKVLDSLLTTNASSKNAKERTAAAKKAIVDLKKKLKAATTKGKAASTALTTVQKKHDRSSTSPEEELCQDNKQELETLTVRLAEFTVQLEATCADETSAVLRSSAKSNAASITTTSTAAAAVGKQLEPLEMAISNLEIEVQDEELLEDARKGVINDEQQVAALNQETAAFCNGISELEEAAPATRLASEVFSAMRDELAGVQTLEADFQTRVKAVTAKYAIAKPKPVPKGRRGRRQ